MSLSAGHRIGVYEILGPIGAGGMGEVYRARDTRLNRDVAIKVLPEVFALDADRLVRFEREAQALASLNHPNIAHIHGVEANALVMELVEGEDLAERIARGAIPLDEALPIARQIAEALQAAHDRGIVHRDLKPANVKVRPDGTVKVLDFGLAKAVDAVGSGVSGPVGGAAMSPTFTSPALMTHAGMIIGTAAYMAPEQAKGKPVDKRADLWAFGVVLYEMLTGRTAFDGETVTDVLAAVVLREPDWTLLPPITPPAIRRLLARCLARDPKRRLGDAGEAAYQIEEALAVSNDPVAPEAPAAGKARTRAAALAVPWVLALIFAAFAAVLAWRQQHQPSPPGLRYSIETPPKTTLNLVSRPALSVSPDGSMVAFIGTSGGTTRIHVRRQDEFEARALAGTEGASEPVFSPDARWLAFYSGNKLNKMPAEGGPIEPLADVNDPRGLSWDADEVITFSPQSTGGVFQISPTRGGTPREITTVKEKVERTHRWAQMLPSGALIFTVGSLTSPDNYDGATIEALAARTGERRVLVKGASMARYFAPGTLLFSRGGAVFAVPFNPDTLEVSGTPTAVMQAVAGDATTGARNFAISTAGTFAYVAGSADGALHRLMWVDRGGRAEPIDLPPGMYFDIALSPDGRRAAMVVVGGGGGDVWVYEFGRKTFTRLTFGGAHRTPVWSPDGSRLYYVALAADGSSNQLVRKPADGSRDEEVITTVKVNIFLHEISRDERVATVAQATNIRKADIATLEIRKDAPLVPLVANEFDEYAADISPDGRWIAFQSDETSRPEIYVRDAAAKGGRWQVSTGGGEEPHWSHDGRELYFRADTQMMVAHVDPGATFQHSTPQLLFDGLFNLRVESGISYSVDPGGKRFLMTRLGDSNVPSTTIRVITNWTTELKRLMQPR
jgi:Tol biopolymer transport system component